MFKNSKPKWLLKGQEYAPIKRLVNAADVSPIQAPIEDILRVDLYGTAVLLLPARTLCAMAVQRQVITMVR